MKTGRRALLGAVGAAVGATAALRSASARPVLAERQMLTTMHHSAFPYEGTVPDTGLPFLDATLDGQIGHMSARGGFYAAQTTYSDRRSLLHVGAGYRGSTSSLVVVFFHGNGATLTRDVILRQRVAEQFDASGIDGVRGTRLAGVVLLDALYGEQERFERWITAHHRRAFFVSAWGNSSLSENVAFNLALAQRNIAVQTRAPDRLAGGGVWSVPSLSAEHRDFVTRAWVDEPMRDLLSRMR